MAFTAAAATELQKQQAVVEWKLEFKLPEGTMWTEFPYQTFKIAEKEDIPCAMSLRLLNDDLDFSDEYKSSGDTRTFIRGHVRMTATVGSESEVKFDGFISDVIPTDYDFEVKCLDWSALAAECDCLVFLAPDEAVVVSETTTTPVQITQISSSLGASYGFPAGTSNAFSSAGLRRSWKRTAVELWDGNDTTSDNQYPQETYSVDYSSGAVKILDHDHASKSYFARYVTAFKETAAGGTNVDAARLIEQAWVTATNVLAVDLSDNTFTFLEADISNWTTGDQFEIQNSTGNDGRYTVSVIAVGSPNSIVTVTETIPDGTVDGSVVHEDDWRSPRFTSDQVDITDTGIDIDREIYYPRKGQDGKVIGLHQFIRDELGVHIKTRWDHNAGKLKVQLVSQQASGSEDWTLYNPTNVSLPRNDRDLATSIRVTGRKSLPINEVTNTAATLSDELTAGTWFQWDGVNVGSDSNFATVSPFMYDGNAAVAAAVHNVNATETTAPGSTYSTGDSKYSEWYNFVKLDMGVSKDIERVRVIMPPSRNINAQVGDGRITSGGDAVGFWPGVKILVSEDGSNWFRLSPLLDGVFKPGAEVDVSGDDLLVPRCRYVFVLCRAYKHGTENQTDPGIGLGELEIYTDISYEVERALNGFDSNAYYRYTYAQDLAIGAVDTGAETFTISGDYTSTFTSGYKFATERTTAGNEVWTVDSSSYSAPNTTITVTGDITEGTADGNVVTDVVHVYAPDFWDRMDQRHKSRTIDVGDTYDEFLAQDVALKNLYEMIRVFQEVSYSSVSDPRIDLYDTVIVSDTLNDPNGDITSILVRGIIHTPDGTVVNGVNYLAATLEDSL